MSSATWKASPRHSPSGAPGLRLGAGGGGAGDGGGGEQGAGLLALVFGEVGARLAFPGLAGDDAAGDADGGADGEHQRRRGGLGAATAPCARVWKASTISASPASTASGSPKARWTVGWPRRGVGVVEAGQVVVDQGGAVQQLDRGRGGVGQAGRVLAAGGGDGEAQAGADAGAARGTRRGAWRRPAGAGSRGGRVARQGGLQRPFDPRHDVHARPVRRLCQL